MYLGVTADLVREWKFALVEASNPQWRDLWDE